MVACAGTQVMPHTHPIKQIEAAHLLLGALNPSPGSGSTLHHEHTRIHVALPRCLAVQACNKCKPGRLIGISLALAHRHT